MILWITAVVVAFSPSKRTNYPNFFIIEFFHSLFNSAANSFSIMWDIKVNCWLECLGRVIFAPLEEPFERTLIASINWIKSFKDSSAYLLTFSIYA